MAKNNRKSAKRVSKAKARRQVTGNNSLSRPTNPTFGAVSTINTAPVAIGNSMRGIRAQTVQTGNDSVRVVGRDFAYTAAGTGTYTGWSLVGGVPLTPACFVSSILRNYVQMYNKFKFNAVRFHYITSSPTSATGDIMFQVNSNRSDPMANQTSNTFLPYALSKPQTVIGPQWTNHSMEIKPKGPYRNLDTGMNTDIDYQAQGEVLLYSKTSTVDSPGYIIIDYDISFAEMAVNPRQGVLPNPLLVWQPIQFFQAGAVVHTANSTVSTWSVGTRWTGVTTVNAITSSANFRAGDIYKVCFDLTSTNPATWTATVATPTAANLFATSAQGANDTMSLTDGFTCYACIESSTNVNFYGSIVDAVTSAQRFLAGVTYTSATYAETSSVPSAGTWLFGMCSYVCTANINALQQQ